MLLLLVLVECTLKVLFRIGELSIGDHLNIQLALDSKELVPRHLQLELFSLYLPSEESHLVEFIGEFVALPLVLHSLLVCLILLLGYLL